MIDFGTFLNELWNQLNIGFDTIKGIGEVSKQTIAILATCPLLGIGFAIYIIKKKK